MKIFTVTLSPVIDRYATCDDLAPYREHTLTDGGRFAGGKPRRFWCWGEKIKTNTFPCFPRGFPPV